MLTEQWIDAKTHASEIERRGNMPSQTGPERIGHRPVEQRVPVGAGRRRVTSIEVVGCLDNLANDDLRPQHAVERPLQRRPVVSINYARNDLAPCVDAGVCAAGTGEVDGRPGHLLDRCGELAANGSDALVRCEAVKIGTTVRDEKANLRDLEAPPVAGEARMSDSRRLRPEAG